MKNAALDRRRLLSSRYTTAKTNKHVYRIRVKRPAFDGESVLLHIFDRMAVRSIDCQKNWYFVFCADVALLLP